jgi:hypothetical protein
VIRYFTKAFKEELEMRPEEEAVLRRLITDFDPSSLNDRTKQWIEKNGKKLFQHAVNLEYAAKTLDRFGLKEKLIALGDPKKEDSLPWWLSRKPLESFEIGKLEPLIDPSRPPGKTARELGIDVVSHETRSFLAYESITRSHVGEPNLFTSRPNAAGEVAAHGEGAYTQRGDHGAVGSGITIHFKMHPDARENVDFRVPDLAQKYVVVQNKNAFRVIPESLATTGLGALALLSGEDFDPARDKALVDMILRRLGTSERPFLQSDLPEVERILRAEAAKPQPSMEAIKLWFSSALSRSRPDFADLFIREGANRSGLDAILSIPYWRERPEVRAWLLDGIRKSTVSEVLWMARKFQHDENWKALPFGPEIQNAFVDRLRKQAPTADVPEIHRTFKEIIAGPDSLHAADRPLELAMMDRLSRLPPPAPGNRVYEFLPELMGPPYTSAQWNLLQPLWAHKRALAIRALRRITSVEAPAAAPSFSEVIHTLRELHSLVPVKPGQDLGEATFAFAIRLARSRKPLPVAVETALFKFEGLETNRNVLETLRGTPLSDLEILLSWDPHLGSAILHNAIAPLDPSPEAWRILKKALEAPSSRRFFFQNVISEPEWNHWQTEQLLTQAREILIAEALPGAQCKMDPPMQWLTAPERFFKRSPLLKGREGLPFLQAYLSDARAEFASQEPHDFQSDKKSINALRNSIEELFKLPNLFKTPEQESFLIAFAAKLAEKQYGGPAQILFERYRDAPDAMTKLLPVIEACASAPLSARWKDSWLTLEESVLRNSLWITAPEFPRALSAVFEKVGQDPIRLHRLKQIEGLWKENPELRGDCLASALREATALTQ